MLQYMMVCLLVVIGVAGLIIEEHKMTEEEPFSACYTFQYKRYMYFGDHERPPTCTPAMYEYHVIFTLSKDPDENVKQMVKKYVKENNIRRLYRMEHSGTCFHDCITFQIFWLFLNIWDLISWKTTYFQSWIYSKNTSVWKSIRKFRDRELSDIIHQEVFKT